MSGKGVGSGMSGRGEPGMSGEDGTELYENPSSSAAM